MNFTKNIRKEAFDKIIDILICPKTKKNLHLFPDYKTLVTEKGNKYIIKNFIPVFESPNNIHNADHPTFDYKTHYNIDADLFDYFEPRTGGTEHGERRLREYIISKIPGSNKKILDVGCGSAWVAEKLSKQNIVCSLDISYTNCDKALTKYNSPNHTAVVADSLNLPFKDESFDIIIASEIIEHVVHPEVFIRELFRCVKKNGTLIISTPYKEVLKYSLCIHCNQKTPVNSHLHSFDEKKLLSLYNDQDIKKSECFTFGNKALMHLRLHVILKYLPFPIWKLLDSFSNAIVNKKANIIIKFTKKD